MESYSDLLMVFMRYGGGFMAFIAVLVGVIYTLAVLDDFEAARFSYARRRKLRSQLMWNLIKLALLFWVGFGLFLTSF